MDQGHKCNNEARENGDTDKCLPVATEEAAEVLGHQVGHDQARNYAPDDRNDPRVVPDTDEPPKQ